MQSWWPHAPTGERRFLHAARMPCVPCCMRLLQAIACEGHSTTCMARQARVLHFGERYPGHAHDQHSEGACSCSSM